MTASRQRSGPADQPTVSVEATLTSHSGAVERRLDLLERCTAIARRVHSSRATIDEVKALVEWVEAADPQTRLFIPNATFEVTTDGIDPNVLTTFTGRATTGHAGVSVQDIVDELRSDPWADVGHIEVLHNNVGDGSDVGTDVWPAAVPPPDYDDLGEQFSEGSTVLGQVGEHPDDDPDRTTDLSGEPISTTSDDAVSPESTDGKDD